MRRWGKPSAENGWLVVGYLVWFCLIYGLWQIVTHLARGGAH